MEASKDPVVVRAKKLPKSRNPQTADSKFWRQFKSKLSDKQIAAVTSVHFCPAPPYDFAVTSSTRVTVYDGETCEVKKVIAKFTDIAYSGCFRSDGQLLAAGGETGVIQVFDISTKTVLRHLKGHSRSVHWVRYSEVDKLHVLSGSDDNTVRWWDVATEETVRKFEGHGDYVRCGDYNPVNHDIWATGSYDHTVHLWDTRAAKSICQLQHGKPLEDVLFFPSGGIMATAGGNLVKIWDIIGGGKLLHALGTHQKTVTKLAFTYPSRSKSPLADDAPRLLTASLDGHLKVFDTSEFKVSHNVKYPDPILSFGVSPPCTTLVVGGSSGLLSVRQRKPVVTPAKKTEQQLRPNNIRYFIRGRAETASDEDYVFLRAKRKNYTAYDKLMLQFRYKDSLIAGLKANHATIPLVLMEELVARQMLLQVLQSLDPEELELLFTYISKYITLPMYSRTLVPLTSKVLELCGMRLGASEGIKNKVTSTLEKNSHGANRCARQVFQLQSKIREEIELQKSLHSFQGMLQMLIQASVA